MYGDIIRQLDLNTLYKQCFTVLNAGKDIQFPKLQFNKLDVPGNVDRILH
jgi:hypothetical protein